MYMKKLLMSLVLCGVVFGSVDTARAASTDDIMNACYATSKCGAKTNLKKYTPIVTAGLAGGAGAATAGLALATFSPYAAGAGIIVAGGAMGYAGYMFGDYIGGKMSAAYDANEFIYFDDGTCIECDDHQIGENYECPNGTIVFNGDKAMRCKTTTTGDYWDDVNLPVCAKSPIKNKSEKNTLVVIDATVGKQVHSGVGVYSGDACFNIVCVSGYDAVNGKCLKKEVKDDKDDRDDRVREEEQNKLRCPVSMPIEQQTQCLWCYREKDAGAPANWNGTTCNCGDKHVWNKTTGKCEIKGGGNDGGESSLQKCLKERTAANGYSDEARACCYLSKSVAKVSSDKQRCECIDSTKEFKINSGAKGGRCVAKSGGDDDKVDVTGYDCSDFMEGLLELKKKCAEVPTASQVRIQIEKFIAECNAKQHSSAVAWDKYLVLSEEAETNCTVKNEFASYEGKRQNMAAEAIARINSLHTSLEGVRSGFKVSVWKDEEGKFNTARLASDSIAGVVLGTAGGLITSSVVKKNQEKKGFEDLQCTIGGQRVADWGDQFTAGWAR